MTKRPIFITGNQNKANYLAKTLGIELDHHKLDLDEIQSTSLEEIVEHKVNQAYAIIKEPVLVEDVALKFTALGELPGPFIKFFIESPDGLEKLCRILDSFDDQSARAECVFGYYDGTEVQMIRGGLDGDIAQHPRGRTGYGFDRIFQPDGCGGRTRAELDEDEDLRTYRIMKPFAALKEFLES